MNARQGIETRESLQVLVRRESGGETMNARQGIET